MQYRLSRIEGQTRQPKDKPNLSVLTDDELSRLFDYVAECQDSGQDPEEALTVEEYADMRALMHKTEGISAGHESIY